MCVRASEVIVSNTLARACVTYYDFQLLCGCELLPLTNYPLLSESVSGLIFWIHCMNTNIIERNNECHLENFPVSGSG